MANDIHIANRVILGMESEIARLRTALEAADRLADEWSKFTLQSDLSDNLHLGYVTEAEILYLRARAAVDAKEEK